MTISPELITAYRWHRARWHSIYTNHGARYQPLNAAHALAAARNDVATGTARFHEARIWPAVTWQQNRVRNLPFPRYSRVIANIDKPERAGLRHVGDVEAESYGGRGCFSGRDSCGWYTDPHGDVFKDGTGLCWGVVYQLPGRDGKARFVAGYQFGGTDSGPTLDMSEIFEDDARSYGYRFNADELDGAREAARRADDMAKDAADNERQYQTAWQAGVQYADTMEERASAKAELRELLAERLWQKRLLPNDIAKKSPAICRAIEAQARALLASIIEAGDKAAKLAQGDGGLYLTFWPGDPDLQAAFNEAAGADII